MSILLRILPAAALLAGGVAALADDRADLDRTQVIGNRELPKVLYIAPWKKPPPGDLAGRPLISVLDDPMGPVDRDVFRRTVQYDTQARISAAQQDKQAAALVPLVAGPPAVSAAAPAPTRAPAATNAPAPAVAPAPAR